MTVKMDLSKLKTAHFNVEELCKSDTATLKKIDNTPNEEQVQCLLRLMQDVLEPARESLGKPIVVTSGFRCQKLNTLVGGVKTSQHTKGQAADLVCNKYEDKRRLFNILMGMDVDQLLFERNSKGTQWIHVSYVSPEKNRNDKRDNYIVK